MVVFFHGQAGFGSKLDYNEIIILGEIICSPTKLY